MTKGSPPGFLRAGPRRTSTDFPPPRFLTASPWLCCGEVVHIPTFSGVNILGWSHCCSCPLGSFLFHCNLFPQTQVACASGEYSILHIPNNQHFRKDSNNYYQVIGLTLSVSNLLGYLRCRLGRTESTSALISGVANQYLQVRHTLKMLF